ncbi:MAG: alanine racemase [Acidobacteriota bacterium]
MNRSWIEVSASRLRHNAEAIRRRLRPPTSLIAVVKANAYGHGVSLVAPTLHRWGIRDFAVADLEEALELRGDLPGARILVLGGCGEGEEDVFRRHQLTAGVFDRRSLPEDLRVEVKIDTGMTRLGIPWTQAPAFFRESRLGIAGVYSHFSRADSDPGFTQLQLERFLRSTRGLSCPRHISNSAGLRFPAAHLDAVRVGLALYGISPCPEITDVQPALCWKTRILAVNRVPAGRVVGYEGTFTTRRRKSRIGVLPVGYGDGYKRALSNRASVRVGRHLAPVAGLISMDLTGIDLTDIREARAGDEVTLLEPAPDSPLSATALAQTVGTIPYEIFTSITARVKRLLVED